jgi:BON domain
MPQPPGHPHDDVSWAGTDKYLSAGSARSRNGEPSLSSSTTLSGVRLLRCRSGVTAPMRITSAQGGPVRRQSAIAPGVAPYYRTIETNACSPPFAATCGERDILDELLFDPSINAANLQVSADHGTVTLSGSLASYTEKLAAQRATRRVRGVVSVADKDRESTRPERRDGRREHPRGYRWRQGDLERQRPLVVRAR